MISLKCYYNGGQQFTPQAGLISSPAVIYRGIAVSALPGNEPNERKWIEATGGPRRSLNRTLFLVASTLNPPPRSRAKSISLTQEWTEIMPAEICCRDAFIYWIISGSIGDSFYDNGNAAEENRDDAGDGA